MKMMIKIQAFLLALCILVGFCGCSNTPIKNPTCEEIAQIYTEAGYYVCHYHSENYEGAYCHVSVWEEEHLLADTDSIDFYFFEDERSAQAHAKEYEWNLLLYGFGLLYGETRWCFSKSYGCISYQYFGRKMTKPLNALIHG